eukprot:TRINITY_DN12627_c0_g1_i1.p2 TRINITY_DN12627_c0_g1~~TRINITY_DN12627_c0_g1_i1.p2  ORF type:complete len:246 (+),score=65.77 TRINITY_DN12627_c0_g1_i1:64-738(+)
MSAACVQLAQVFMHLKEWDDLVRASPHLRRRVAGACGPYARDMCGLMYFVCMCAVNITREAGMPRPDYLTDEYVHELHRLAVEAFENAPPDDAPGDSLFYALLENYTIFWDSLNLTHPADMRMLPTLRRHLAVQERLFGRNSPRLVPCLTKLAHVTSVCGEAPYALEKAKRAQAILRQESPSEVRDTRINFLNVVHWTCYSEMGDEANAAKYAKYVSANPAKKD